MFEFIEPLTFALAAIIIFGAYFIFGVSGFGASIVAVPLLVQIYPLKSVVPMMVMIDVCGSLYLGNKNSRNADMKELKWLFPFTLIGIVVG
ncbi:MAG: sulfite exporter TauE/SafE family protein, partial [Betaproteobacteria bacterium]|nr:sulfite exporter TauE/SafE family protein [Betaproteobacteria bacterium]